MVNDVVLSAECSVLGSFLIEPKVAGDIFSRLRPESFSDSTYRNIFKAARDIYFSGGELDAVVVLDRMGKAYETAISEIMRVTPTAANYSVYCDLVLEQGRVRRLNELGAALMSVQDFEAGLSLLAKAEGLLSQRANKRSSTYTEMIHEYLDRQEDRTAPNYVDWGIPQLNRLNVSPGRFVILGADSSVGKTAFALQLAANVARKGKRVGFFSYETSRADAIDRILANTANVVLARSKERKLTQQDYYRVSTEGVTAPNVPLTVIESAEYTVDELKAETLAERFEVVFIDYLQLIPAANSGARWQDVGGVSMALHSMAQRLGVTVVALSQVTLPEKGKNGVRPHVRKDNLRESRQLKMDADIILMLDYEDTGKQGGPRILIVDKNKDGPLAEMRMNFDPKHMRFSVVDRRGEEQKAMDEKADKIIGQTEFDYVDDPTPFEQEVRT